MNFSLTIPGVFYDLIARVIPGYFLVLITRLLLPDVYAWANRAVNVEREEGFAALASMLGFTVTCYLLGWLLHGITVLMRMARWARPEAPKDLYRQYHYVKLKNESVGYRLLKLRAEATMLETCLVAGTIVFTADVIVRFVHQEPLAAVLRLLTYSVIIGSIFVAYRLAWERYHGTVESNYELLIT